MAVPSFLTEVAIHSLECEVLVTNRQGISAGLAVVTLGNWETLIPVPAEGATQPT